MEAETDPVVHRPGESALKYGLIAALVLLAAACSVSDDREIALGRMNAEQIDAKLPLVNDTVVNDYIQALDTRLYPAALQTSRVARRIASTATG